MIGTKPCQMSKRGKIAVVAIVAAVSLGGLAPSASARRTIGENAAIAAQRLDRGSARLVENVRRRVERDVLQAGQEIERTGHFLERNLTPPR